MMELTESTKVSRAWGVVSRTCPFWPPMEISTFFPACCFAFTAALNSASDSTPGHSVEAGTD